MMKKFLSSTLTLCMMLSLLPAAAFAQETQMDSGVPARPVYVKISVSKKM